MRLKSPSWPPARARFALALARALARALQTAALLVIAAVVAAAWIFPPARLTPLVRDGLERALAMPVSLGQARLVLLPAPALELDRLVIGNRRDFAPPRAWPRTSFASASKVRASIELAPLLERRLVLRAVRLENAQVTALVNEAGIDNWAPAARPRAAAAPRAAFELSLRRLDVARAAAAYFDARSARFARVERWDGSLTLTTRGSNRDVDALAHVVVRGLGDRRPWPLGATPIGLSLDLASDRARETWTIRRLALERGRLKLSGRGAIEGADRVVSFRLDQSQLSLDALLELVPRGAGERLNGLSGSGVVRVGLEARGPLARGGAPAIRARAQLDGGTLRFRGGDVAIESLGFDLLATEHGADLKRLTGRVGRSAFSIAGMARDWNAPRVRAAARANLDLAEVGRFLPLADSTRLAGRADVELEGAGRIRLAALVPAATAATEARVADFGWSGRARLAGVAVQGIGLGLPARDINGEIGVAPAHAWVKDLRAVIGSSDVACEATIDRPVEFARAVFDARREPPPDALCRFALRARVIDGDELFPARARTEPLPRVRAEGTIEIGAVRLRRFTATRLAGRLRYANGVVEAQDCVAEAYGGSVRGGARFDWTEPARPTYRAHAVAESLDANALLASWTPIEHVAFGTLQLTADLDGQGTARADFARDFTMSGLAQILRGRLAGASVLAKIAEFTGVDRFRLLSFRDLSAPFRVKNGRVEFDPIALAGDGTDWLARGSIGLDGTLDFRIAALISAAEVARLPAALARGAGAATDHDGRLTLDFVLAGTVTRPTVTWDPARTLSRLLARAPEGIDTLARSVGVDLADTLSISRAALEKQAQATIDAQRRALAEEAARQREALEKKARDELSKLFSRPATPVDTSALDSTFQAPP